MCINTPGKQLPIKPTGDSLDVQLLTVPVCPYVHTHPRAVVLTHIHTGVLYLHTPLTVPLGCLLHSHTHTHTHWGVCCIYMHAPHTHRLFVAFTHTPATQFAVFTYTPTAHLTYVCCIYTHAPHTHGLIVFTHTPHCLLYLLTPTRVFVVVTHTHRTVCCGYSHGRHCLLQLAVLTCCCIYSHPPHTPL